MRPESKRTEPLDINILPEEYRPRMVSPAIRLVWLVAIVLLVPLVPAFVLTLRNRAQAEQASDALSQGQQALAELATSVPEVVALTEELSRTLHALEVVQAVYPTIAAGERDWASVFEAILSRDAERIQVADLFQEEDDLRLIGYALTQEDVLAYKGDLERSGVFGQVMVQSMQSAALPTPVPTGTATPVITPTAIPGTPTAAPGPYDAYEIDDFDPGAISVGEIQWHSFNPVYDVDQVTFLGKAGRRYCIQALPQANGVDTYLEVVAGESTYANDDCYPGETVLLSCQCPTGTVTGSLASLAEVQVPASHDVEVRIRVSNRGQYGPDQWYTLLVHEPAGDPWEKDDQSPKPIFVGEAQARTFYPDGDVDRVTFTVKGGSAYELRTLNLAMGVDTALSVLVDGIVHYNDDASPGDRSSRVSFQAALNGVAEAAVTNRGQFGADMSYVLQLLEMGGDSYEPDEYYPRPLSPWEHQRHTFYPVGDIDRVEFNVKVGHIYALRTYSLTVGVDTVLSVLVSGVRYENDDVYHGDHSSRIVFTASHDGTAGVTISNREQYGPNREYWLTLSELAPTPTPGLTTTPVPTPDCADQYEPDDIVPRFMVVNEEQKHNFCRPGDRDRVVFTAKDGYAYQVETRDLAPGVDTYITVQIGSTTFPNDDRGPQDLSSLVRIQNVTGRDAPAFVNVVNKGLFGLGTTYTLKVSDVGSGDPFELDDVEPVPIGMSAPQKRTFYPPGDVDRVYFVAKAGHRYRIFTANLADLVDTTLCADMGSLHECNDDRASGDLSSYVELQNDGSADTRVVVTIFNNGEDGPARSYSIQVDDLGAETGDAYEPDLTTKRYISVRETQLHTFDPYLDTDRVTLIVKGGRQYVVSTCGNAYDPAIITSTCESLVPGVDTLLVAVGPIQSCDPASCQNDDADPGSGSLISRLAFTVTVDGEVDVTIYNQGQFGPTMQYYLRVDEVAGPTPTPVLHTPTPYYSPTPMPTSTPVPPPSPTPTLTPTCTPTLTPTTGTAGALFPGGRRHIGLGAPLPEHAGGRRLVGTRSDGTVIRFELLLAMKSVEP